MFSHHPFSEGNGQGEWLTWPGNYFVPTFMGVNSLVISILGVQVVCVASSLIPCFKQVSHGSLCSSKVASFSQTFYFSDLLEKDKYNSDYQHSLLVFVLILSSLGTHLPPCTAPFAVCFFLTYITIS